MKIPAAIAIALAGTLAAGCSATTQTRVVEPAPATASQRTVYPDGSSRTTTVAPAPTTTTVYR